MYLNLLFKSIKADADNIDRVVALVRRFIQVLVSGGSGATEVVAGGLYLLGEVSPLGHLLLLLPDDGGKKLFSSVPGLRSTIYQTVKPDDGPYDPRKRDPQFAHARSSALWEIVCCLVLHCLKNFNIDLGASVEPLSSRHFATCATTAHFPAYHSEPRSNAKHSFTFP